VYYLALCVWLASFWLAGETLPPSLLTLAILFFSAGHDLGYWSLRNEREQLAAATRTVERDSSILELTALMALQDRSKRPMMAFIVVHDGLEFLMFAWVLFYLFSAISVSR